MSEPAPSATPAVPAAPAAAPAVPATPAVPAVVATPAIDAAAVAAAVATPPAAPAVVPAAPVVPAGAPESYKFDAPEGVTYDPAVIDKFGAVAKELNLTQDAASKLVTELSPLMAQQQMSAVTKVQDGWLESSKIDTEIGGANLDANMAVAMSAFDKFGTPELKTFLKDSKLGNHPELVRWAYRVGKAMSPDTVIPGSKQLGADQGKSFEERAAAKLYGPKAA